MYCRWMLVRVHAGVPITPSGLRRAFAQVASEGDFHLVTVDPDPEGAEFSLLEIHVPHAQTANDAELTARGALVRALQAHSAATGIDLGWTARFEVMPDSG